MQVVIMNAPPHPKKSLTLPLTPQYLSYLKLLR